MQTFEDGRELELRDYLAVVDRRKWTIALTTVLVVVAALGLSLTQTKVYEGTAEVLLQSRTSERIFSPDGDEQLTNNFRGQVETEIQVMKSRSITQAVEAVLGAKPDVNIRARGETQVVAISAESTDPAEAARIANTYAGVYITERRQSLIADLLDASNQIQAKITEIDDRLGELDDQDGASAAGERQSLLTLRATYGQQLSQLQLAGNLTESGGAQLVSEAEVPEAPVRPTPKRDGALALVVGLMLGVGIAFLRDYLDDSLRTKDDLEKATGLTVLASIPEVATWKKGDRPKVVSLDEPTSQAAEAYRSLRTSIQFLSLDRPMELVQVTSAGPGDGKSTTVANLAVALARAGQRVIVIDCDLRRPRIHQFFGLPNAVGLTSALVGEVSLADAVQQVPGENRITLLASGPLPPNPSELLSSRRAASLFQNVREVADVVLVDSPPVLPVTDAVVLASHMDAVLLVGTASGATKRAAHRAAESLRLVGAPAVGAVLNGASVEEGYGYGYGYGSRHDSVRSAPGATAKISKRSRALR